MADWQFIEELGKWEGYRIEMMERDENGDVLIELVLDPTHVRTCSGCGLRGAPIHDSTPRWIRDLPILGAATWLWVDRVRVACPKCGPKVEVLSWLSPYSRVTKRLAESVARLCKVLPIKHVAEHFELGWGQSQGN